jgi:hypothetical protein
MKASREKKKTVILKLSFEREIEKKITNKEHSCEPDCHD